MEGLKQFKRKNNNDDDDDDDDDYDSPPPSTPNFDPWLYYPPSPNESEGDSDIKGDLNPTQKFFL